MSLVKVNKEKNKEYIRHLKSLTDEELMEMFDCDISKICRGNYIAQLTSDTVCPYKVILGYANMAASKVESLGDLEFVGMEDTADSEANYGLILCNSLVKDLGNVKKVYGNLSLETTRKIQNSLGKVEFVGGNLYLDHTPITSIDNLKEIGGVLSISESFVTSLGSLEKVGKIYSCSNENFKDLGNLKEVGTIIFHYRSFTEQPRHRKVYNIPAEKKFLERFSRDERGIFVRNEVKKEQSFII